MLQFPSQLHYAVIFEVLNALMQLFGPLLTTVRAFHNQHSLPFDSELI